jgi:hypothetical protein
MDALCQLLIDDHVVLNNVYKMNDKRFIGITNIGPIKAMYLLSSLISRIDIKQCTLHERQEFMNVFCQPLRIQ